MEIIDQFNDSVNGIFLPILETRFVRPLLTLFLVLYGGLAAPKFAQDKMWLFDKLYFRLAYLFLIGWTANHDPALATIMAVVFLMVMNKSVGKGFFEKFEGPQTAVYPGCMNMTVYDLLEAFQNDKEKLLDAMLRSKVPGDVKLTDYYAPLIATYLFNHGYVFKSPCMPPGSG